MAAIRSARHVSRLTRETLALVLAGGRGSRLKMLTDWRAKPAVPFGGKFRIIDFALSNCVNSGLRRICVLTPGRGPSLGVSRKRKRNQSVARDTGSPSPETTCRELPMYSADAKTIGHTVAKPGPRGHLVGLRAKTIQCMRAGGKCAKTRREASTGSHGGGYPCGQNTPTY